MSPRNATIIYVGFICWLFWRYRKEAGPTRVALWIPFLWCTINLSRPVLYWFSNGTAAAAADSGEGNPVDRNIYFLLMGIGVVILAKRRIEWGRILYNFRWLLFLLGYYLFSILWASDPFVSFKRWIKESGDIIMILIIITEADPIEAVRAVFVRCVYLLIPLSVLMIKYYPEIGRYLHPWTWQTFYCGITVGKNALGLLVMLSGFFMLWQVVDMYPRRGQPLNLVTLRKNWPDVIVFAMCLWLLNLAGSATSFTCFILGIVIFFASRLGWVRSNLGSLGWCVMGAGLIMAIFSVSPSFRGVIAGLLGRDATLTDRTLIWDLALKSGSNPIVGCGFESYWLSGKGNEIIRIFHVDYAHNAYLDVYLETGLAGVLFFATMLFSAGKNAVNHFSNNSPLGYLFMTLFWSCLLYNYTEISFGRSNVFGLLIFMMAGLGAYVPSPQESETVPEPEESESPEPSSFVGYQKAVTGL